MGILFREDTEGPQYYQSLYLYFLKTRHLRCMFMTFIVIKENGIFIKGTALLVQYYAGALGNDYSIWKDVSSSRNHGTLVNKTIQEIVRKFPKYFSRGHKNCVQTLTENLMLDKISLPSLVLFTQNLPETTL